MYIIIECKFYDIMKVNIIEDIFYIYKRLSFLF